MIEVIKTAEQLFMAVLQNSYSGNFVKDPSWSPPYDSIATKEDFTSVLLGISQNFYNSYFVYS